MWPVDRKYDTRPNFFDLTLKSTSQGLDAALKAFKHGQAVLIHDDADREDETDLVYPAHAVDPSDVQRLRNDAGGLVCVALPFDIAESFELPFLDKIVNHPAGGNCELGYDDRSSFSLTVNHEDTYTGITDNDRAKTISELGEAAKNPESVDFASSFNIPGHVHLLKASPGLLKDRQGHTELGIKLAEAANIPRAVVVCEMLDDQTGGALSRSSAVSYANDHGIPFIDGETIINCLSEQ